MLQQREIAEPTVFLFTVKLPRAAQPQQIMAWRLGNHPQKGMHSVKVRTDTK